MSRIEGGKNCGWWKVINGRTEYDRQEILGHELRQDWQDFLDKTARKARRAFEKSTGHCWSVAINGPVEIVGFYFSSTAVLPIVQLGDDGCFMIAGKTAKGVEIRKTMVTFPWGSVLKTEDLNIEGLREIAFGSKKDSEGARCQFVSLFQVEGLLLTPWQETPSKKLEEQKKLLEAFAKRVNRSRQMV